MRVVNSLHWETSAGATRVPTIIGEAITSSYHQGEAVGHNGFVIQDRAPVSADIYNPITQTGSIIPVNGRPARVMNQTNTHTGEIIEFTGPNDLLLDPARAVIAVNMYGENSLDVNGVTFLGDRENGSVTSNGVTVTTDAGYFADDYSDAPNFSGGPADSAANLDEIMRDIRWEYGSNKFEVTVSGLLPGGVYHLQLLTNESSPWDRRYDVVVNDRLVVDNFTSHGDSARHAWNASNSFAYAGEFIASPSGEIVIKLGANFGGYGPINGTDSNPLLQAVVVHHAESASPDHEFGVAWYELKEGIRWPHKAIGYDPVWPTNPDRIVIASRLGSEGLNRSYVDPAGGINVANPDTASYTSFNPGPHASWIPPDSATGEHVNYHQVGVVPLSNGNPFFAYTWGRS